MSTAVNIIKGGFKLRRGGEVVAEARTIHGEFGLLSGVDVQVPGSSMTELVKACAFDRDNAHGVAVRAVCRHFGYAVPEYAERAYMADLRERTRAREEFMDDVRKRKPAFMRTDEGRVVASYRGEIVTTIVPVRGATGSVRGAQLVPALDGPKERFWLDVDGNTIADVIRAAARAIEVYCEEMP